MFKHVEIALCILILSCVHIVVLLRIDSGIKVMHIGAVIGIDIGLCCHVYCRSDGDTQ